MSTTLMTMAGWTIRSLRSGMSMAPPPIQRASSPWRAARPIASLRDVGWSRSNGRTDPFSGEGRVSIAPAELAGPRSGQARGRGLGGNADLLQMSQGQRHQDADLGVVESVVAAATLAGGGDV